MLKKTALFLFSLTFTNLSYGATLNDDSENLKSLDRLLTRLSIDINSINNQQLPIPLTLSCKESDQTKKDIITLLIKHGASINKCDDERSCPLLTALMNNSSPDIVRFLIQNGANYNNPLSSVMPIEYIVLHKKIDMLDIIFEECKRNRNAILILLFGMEQFKLIDFYENKGIKLSNDYIEALDIPNNLFPAFSFRYNQYLEWKSQQQ